MLSEQEQNFMLYYTLLRGAQGGDALRVMLSDTELTHQVLENPSALAAVFSEAEAGPLTRALRESGREEAALMALLRRAGIPVKPTLKQTLEDKDLRARIKADGICWRAVRRSAAFAALELVNMVSGTPQRSFSGAAIYQDARFVYLYSDGGVWRAPAEYPTFFVQVGRVPCNMNGAAVYADDTWIYFYSPGGGPDKILRAPREDPAAVAEVEGTLPHIANGGVIYTDADSIYLYGGAGNSTRMMSARRTQPDTFTELGKTLPAGIQNGVVLEAGEALYLFGGSSGSAQTILRAAKSAPDAFEAAAQRLPVTIQYPSLLQTQLYHYLYDGSTAKIYRAPAADPTAFASCGSFPEAIADTPVFTVKDRIYFMSGSRHMSADVAQPETVTNLIGGDTFPNIPYGRRFVSGDSLYHYDTAGNVWRSPKDEPWRAEQLPGGPAPWNASAVAFFEDGEMLYVFRSDTSAQQNYMYQINKAQPQAWSNTRVFILQDSSSSATKYYAAEGRIYIDGTTVYIYLNYFIYRKELSSLSGTLTPITTRLPFGADKNLELYVDGEHIYLYGCVTDGGAYGIWRASVHNPVLFVEMGERLPAALASGSHYNNRLLVGDDFIYLVGAGTPGRKILRARREEPYKFEVMKEELPTGLSNPTVVRLGEWGAVYDGANLRFVRTV